MSARAMALALGVVFCAARPAHAQQDTLHLTLDRALRLAQANNPAYRQKENSAHAAATTAHAAWMQFLPRINAGLSSGGGSNTTVTGQDSVGRPLRLETATTYQSSHTTQSLSLSLTLFDGFQTLNSAHAASAQRDAAVAAVDAQGLQLEHDIKTDFYTALLNERLIAVEERVLKSYRDRLAATQRRFENAGADQSDVLGAQVAVAQQAAAVAQQQGAAEKSLLVLRQTIGISDTTPISVTGDFPEAFDPTTGDTTALLTRAIEENPGVAQSIATARAAHAAAAAAHATRWPTITGSLNYSRSMSLLNSYQAVTELNPLNHGISFGINVTVPLSTMLQPSQQIAQANAQSANADETLRQQRLVASTDARSALIDLRNAYQQVQLAEQSADLARRRLALSQQRYQAGSTTINFTELQQIADQEANAERTALRARATFATALATLEQRVGGKVGP